MALKDIHLQISDLTASLLHDSELKLQSGRPEVLVQNEQLQKQNEQLQTQNKQLLMVNAALVAQNAEFQQTLEQQIPIIQEAEKIPQLLEFLKAKEEEINRLHLKLQQAQAIIMVLQEQLQAKSEKATDKE